LSTFVEFADQHLHRAKTNLARCLCVKFWLIPVLTQSLSFTSLQIPRMMLAVASLCPAIQMRVCF